MARAGHSASGPAALPNARQTALGSATGCLFVTLHYLGPALRVALTPASRVRGGQRQELLGVPCPPPRRLVRVVVQVPRAEVPGAVVPGQGVDVHPVRANAPSIEGTTALIEIAKIANYRFDDLVADANAIASARVARFEQLHR
jgi:hypothetical protein